MVIGPDSLGRLTLRQRRLLSPGFSISYLNGLEPLMLQCVLAFVETLDSRCADGKGSAFVDMYGMMGNLTSVSNMHSTDINGPRANQEVGRNECNLFRRIIRLSPNQR